MTQPIDTVQDLLTAGQVATMYGLTRQGVTQAARLGKLTAEEAVLTPLGWMITKEGAERLWGEKSRKKGEVKES